MTPLSFWSAGDLPSEWHWRESSVDPAGLVCRQCHAAGRLRGARRGGRAHSEDMWCTPSGAAGHGGGEFPGAPGADLMGLSGGWLPGPPQSIQTMNPPTSGSRWPPHSNLGSGRCGASTCRTAGATKYTGFMVNPAADHRVKFYGPLDLASTSTAGRGPSRLSGGSWSSPLATP